MGKSVSIDGIKYNFNLYENTEVIDIGEYYLMGALGEWTVIKCDTENEKFEINPNDLVKKNAGDMIAGFWRNCYKIKETNFNYKNAI